MFHRWRSLPFKRQILITTTAILWLTVILMEFFIEPITEKIFTTVAGDIVWHEIRFGCWDRWS